VADELKRLKRTLAERYSVHRELGRGGMATVYLAHDLRHDRPVALKVLRPELAAALGTERFLREITLTARLEHPHVLPLLDSGDADGLLFYVMPYVEGETLRDRLDREKQLPLADALQIASEVTDALGYAHSLGVVHRDIKPDNILLSRGHCRVADFGIARAVAAAGDESVTQLTQTGVAVGTPNYMSPEQGMGSGEVDTRTDLYALGCVLHEMLTGTPPFTGESAQEIIAKHAVEPSPGLPGLRDVPSGLDRVLRRCLAKTAAGRYATAGELKGELAACQAELSARPLALRLTLRRPVVMAGIVAAGLGVLALGAWSWLQQSRAAWARNQALPEAARLIDDGQSYAAFRLLRKAEQHLPKDPVLREMFMELTSLVTVQTTPPGAEVYVRGILDEPDAWEFLGRAPIEGVRVPMPKVAWKVSLEGFQTRYAITFAEPGQVQFSLQPSASAPEDMVHLPAGGYELFSSGPVAFDDYWIDRYEVTNAQFREFIARGGYERREHWTEPFVQDGGPLSWDEAQRLFRDRTGRPGPATWELGAYPEGQDDYPVGGVSWYEAAAYCASLDKNLPTIFHWYNAAALEYVRTLAVFSNFAGVGPEPVGHPLRMGGYGTYDMAGNVKEWTWNPADERRRYILGGAWNEPSYQFSNPDAQDPLNREETYGFRCAKYRAPLADQLLREVDAPFLDYRLETPVGDELFAAYESLYRYDPLPLDPRLEAVDDNDRHWRIERVSFAAAYGDERVPALLFVPTNAAPPYQTVIYFPGAGPFLHRPSFGPAEAEVFWLLFLVRSGRAVLFPAYKGSFERYIGPLLLPHLWRDILIHSGKDLGRAIDYLESREDVDTSKLAYVGWSFGAMVGPIMTAIEPRFEASVLLKGGLWHGRWPGEADPLNFLPRVRVPTLMVNGLHDFNFPYETSQVPMFNFLGTTPHDKRHRVFDTGHVVSERQEVIKEVLDWLDRYLGRPDHW
jgi:eukaryotic-like serine/threonine-protein kinase